MWTSKKNEFLLPEGVTYLNCAYMGPLPRVTVEAGKRAIEDLANPFRVQESAFFDNVDEVRSLFATLIHCADSMRVAVIPSASYGFSTIARQVVLTPGQTVVVVENQFPSNVYPWMRLCETYGGELITVAAPKIPRACGRKWNEDILAAIDARTAVVAIDPLHWTDGTMFDLFAIGRAAKQQGALFIVDGSQAVGAMPIDVAALQPDALVCAGYKWLFQPYGASLAYFGERFDHGIPLEDNWLAREGSRDFRNLTRYTSTLRPKALRYSSGQHPAQIHIAMQKASLQKLLEWGVESVAGHCRRLFDHIEPEIRSMGMLVEDAAFRAPHLFGLRFSRQVDLDRLRQRLEQNKVYISLRGDSVRISPHLYNELDDMDMLVTCLKSVTPGHSPETR